MKKMLTIYLSFLAFSLSSYASEATFKATACTYSDFSEVHSVAFMTSFKLNDVPFTLYSEENPVYKVLWKFGGEVELLGVNKRYDLGRGDAVTLTSNETGKCQELTLILPANEFKVSVQQSTSLPLPSFCGDVNGYTGPCLVKTITAKGTVKFLKSKEVLKLRSSDRQFFFRGEWH